MNKTCEGKDIIIESPCTNCKNKATCEAMCYPRLEWSVFDFQGNSFDESFSTYGDSKEVSRRLTY